jgi:hypothetical protein
MKPIKLNTAGIDLIFAPEGGGFPTRINVHEFGGTVTKLMDNSKPMLSFKNGESTLVPVFGSDAQAHQYQADGAEILEFPKIRWREEGAETEEYQDDIYLSLKWEFFPDGTCFCDMFFYYATLDVPELKDFCLSVPLDFSNSDDVKWAVCKFPAGIDGAIIQNAAPERFIPDNSSRQYSDLFASVNFNVMRHNGPSLFAEFFMEGNNSLFNRPDSITASSVEVNGESSFLKWNFQASEQKGNRRPLHWRNRWGFTVKPALRKRNHPPFAMYHYLDNFQRIPTPEQVKEIADAGAGVLILHDCWRLDTQNGGIPYDEKRLTDFIEQAHKFDLRLCFYVRGNEQSVREDAASWFDNYLRRDFDGLYMDYGGPLGFFTTPDENYPGGRLLFREYYQCMRKLRERIGKNGLLLTHTGSGYSGIAMDFFDSYVSGEGERGILVQGKREHEYFTMAPVAPGSMWTAAFPEYSSPLMTPFLAATGQAPHIPLGVQIMSSSLTHPPVPGINDLNIKDLLYCWSLLEKGIGYEFFSDYNSAGIFAADDDNIAHYLILSPDKKSGLMFVANLSGSTVKTTFKSSAKIPYKLYAIPGQPVPENIKELAPYEFCAALLADSDELAADIISKHPYPREHAPGKIAAEYLAELEKQKMYRNSLPACEDCQLRVYMPSRITSHEQSLWDDLYNVDISLRTVIGKNEYKHLGYVSKNGLEEKVPHKELQIQPGDYSKTIDLAKLLGPGTHRIELYSEQNGTPFYSFVTAELTIDEQERKAINFVSQLENDRAILHWTLNIN